MSIVCFSICYQPKCVVTKIIGTEFGPNDKGNGWHWMCVAKQNAKRSNASDGNKQREREKKSVGEENMSISPGKRARTQSRMINTLKIVAHKPYRPGMVEQPYVRNI